MQFAAILAPLQVSWGRIALKAVIIIPPCGFDILSLTYCLSFDLACCHPTGISLKICGKLLILSDLSAIPGIAI